MNRRDILAHAARAVALAGCSLPGHGFADDDEGARQSGRGQPKSVVVIGGGIAGLTCAYALRDQDLLVLEQAAQVGGRTLSGKRAGFTYAKGTEYLGKLDGALADLAEDLDLEPKEIPSPMDAYFDGKRFHFGQHGLRRHLIEHSSAAAYRKFKALIREAFRHYDELPSLEYDETNRRLDHITAAQWLRDNGIPEVFIKKYNVTSKGLFGATLNEISALSFIPEAAFDYDDTEEEADDESERSGAYSFTTGITALTEALARALSGKLRLCCAVVSVKKVGELFAVSYRDAQDRVHTVTSRKVVLATPAPISLSIASTVLSEERARILQSVGYAAYATVALFSDTPIFDKAFDLAVPEGYFFTDVYDATWVERRHDKSKKHVREGIASVYVAPAGGHDKSLLELSDQDLLGRIYADLEKIFPGVAKRVVGHDIERFRHAYPIMSVGAYGRLRRLDRLNAGALVLAGDYTIYPTFEAAAQSGFIAAQRVRA